MNREELVENMCNAGNKGILAFRMNTGAVHSEYKGNWIEVKAPKGVQSELQKSFQKQVEDHGHRYAICRSVEDVEELLK